MPPRTRAIALCLVAALTLVATSGSAAAAPKRIAGKLSKQGYTVIALAAGGQGTMVLAGRGRFRLGPPAKFVTLHLRAPNGTYAGPIVVGRAKKGRRVLVRVKAGARLGRINVRRGFARVADPAPDRWIDERQKARAQRGVPVGTRNFGYVRSRQPRNLPVGDSDIDGIPDRLDVDDDGDLILDYADPATTARPADHVEGHPAAPEFSVTAYVEPPPDSVTNANPGHSADPSRPAFSDADIDTALRAYGALAFQLEGGPSAQPPFPSPTRSELDCGGDPFASPPKPALKYCSNPNGTGRGFDPAVVPKHTDTPLAFPGPPGGTFDPDGDGFGLFPATLGHGPHIFHGAGSTEFKTGDYLVERGNDANGVETGEVFSTTVQYAFATTPAVASYRDTTMAAPAAVSYPLSSPPVPLEVGAPAGEDVVVTLTFWRPQRRPIPAGPDGRGGDPCVSGGQPCEWVDIGGLAYGAGFCPQSAFLPENDPNLTDASPTAVAGNGGYMDQALDAAADVDHTLTFTVNVSACLRARGQESAFDESGEVVQFSIEGVGRGGGVRAPFDIMRG